MNAISRLRVAAYGLFTAGWVACVSAGPDLTLVVTAAVSLTLAVHWQRAEDRR